MMYRTILTSIVIFSVITINSCAQQKDMVQNPNFSITDSAFSSWVTGDANKSSGMDVTFTVTNLPKNVILDSLFFKGQYAPIQAKKKEGQYVAHFISEKKKDMIISSDMSREVNNPKPQMPKKSPVVIEADEALLVYSLAGEKKCHKIRQIKDKGTKFPAEAPMN